MSPQNAAREENLLSKTKFTPLKKQLEKKLKLMVFSLFLIL